MRTDHRLTAKQDAAFKAEGCDPTCHACHAPIAVGQRYAMISPFGEDVQYDEKPGSFDRYTVKVEVMVCWKCRDAELPDAELKRAAAFLSATKYKRPPIVYAPPGRSSGCMIVNGQVVPGLAEG